MIHQANQYAAPVTQPPPRWGLNYRLDTPSEMKGSPKAFQMHLCRCDVLKRALEILGIRQPRKWGDFVISESQNRMTPREKSSDFT